MNIIKIPSLKKIDIAARQFIDIYKNHKLFAFYGEMGAGKTTFIKALCKQLGVVDDIVNSPTFSIVNEYITVDKKKIYHFDFFRIKKDEEIYDIGFEEYLSNFDYCFIEWPPPIIKNILTQKIISVSIKVLDDNSRVIEHFSKYSP